MSPVKDHVGDAPAVQFTRTVVDAVCVDATEGSKAVKVIPPGKFLNVHAAWAPDAVPNTSPSIAQACFRRRRAAARWRRVARVLLSGSSDNGFIAALDVVRRARFREKP